MVSISDTTLPGVSATVDSATSVAVNISSPGDIGIVGGADLSAGSANENEVYRVTTPIRARQLFGNGSPLAENCVDALGSGAFPVYAAAAEQKEVADEDLSGLGSTSGTLDEGPVVEDASEATFTIDSTEFTTIITLEDPSQKSPASEEVYLNPVTQDFELGTAVSTSGDVTYTYNNYTDALAAIHDEYGDTVDFIGSLSENTAIVDEVQSTVSTMEGQKQFAIAVAGASPNIPETSLYTNPYDDSRVQLLYPSRNTDGESIVGSFLGMRAAIGIQSSPMRKRLRNQTDLTETLSRTQKQDLDSENVVAISNESRGALVVNDPTSVADGNTEEAQMATSLSRLIVDYVTEITMAYSEPFIGGYHDPSTRNQLREVLRSRLNILQNTNAILDFNIVVEEQDSHTARVDLGVETVKALRNVVANITAGEVDTGAIAVSA